MAAYLSWADNQALRKIHQAAQSGKTWLVLERLGLLELPAPLFNLTTLEELVAIDNLIAALPPEIENLKNLKRLDLFYNHIESLPPQIGSLTNLTYLDLSCNHLTSLPLELTQLTQLEHLDLRNNPLPIPAEVLEDVSNPARILSYVSGQELVHA